MRLRKIKTNEKRKFQRVQTELPCILEFDKLNLVGTIIDISQNGLNIKLEDSKLIPKFFVAHFNLGTYWYKYECELVERKIDNITCKFIKMVNDSDDNLGFMLNLIDLGEDLI